MLIFIPNGLEFLGIVLATVAMMIIGMLWYSPVLFGNKWMRLVGMTKTQTSSKSAYISMTLSAFIMSYVLGLFIKNLFVPSMAQAAVAGIVIWLGFIATSSASEYLFNAKQKPWALYYINAGYYLVSLIVSSTILFGFIK